MATTYEANLSLSAARKPLGTVRRLSTLLCWVGVALTLSACGQKGPLVMPPAKATPPAPAASGASAASQPTL